ncbi:MAG: PASTA domain-containing protein [Myxococcales bacterium]|nr:PASTA domain-containing protein [Myxococcales bacterium]
MKLPFLRAKDPDKEKRRRDDPRRARRWLVVRMVLGALLVFGLFSVIIWRAYSLQVVDGKRMREMAEQQYLKQIQLPPRRGTIYDRHGAPLAVSVDVDSVYANPRMIGAKKAPEVAARLAAVLELDKWALTKQLSSKRYFTWVARRIDPQRAKAIKALKIRGVFLTPESRRFYPNQGLGGVVVGFAGLDAKGLEGVELRFNERLRGTKKRLKGLRDALGRPVLTHGHQQAANGGHELVLSIDKFIQHETEAALADAYETVDKERGGWVTAVVLDPRSGDVLAMANAPSYDPNRYAQFKPELRRNRAISDAFEPGSTIKPFTVAGALQLGHIRADQSFDCEKGRFKVGRYWIHDSKPHGDLDVKACLQKSSNICLSKIAMQMGKGALYKTLAGFGFGRASGVELPGERAGKLRRPRRVSDVGLANMSFGHGMTTTVLQLARAFGAIANDGVLMRPRLLLRVRGPLGETKREIKPRGARVLSSGVARTVRDMLVSVTQPGGTAVEAALERYTVAGKTGTAQKVDPVTGTYAKDRWVASFVGLAPASRPRLVIAVVVNEPGGDKHYGGEVAGPIFKRIAAKALRYLGVRPDREPSKKKTVAVTSVAGAIGTAATSDFDPAPPLPGERPGGQVLVPDFTGLSVVEALEAARRAGLRLRIDGHGQAVAQSPGPGPTAANTVARVRFRPPG